MHFFLLEIRAAFRLQDNLVRLNLSATFNYTFSAYEARQLHTIIGITLEQSASSDLYKFGHTSLSFALTESTDALSPR